MTSIRKARREVRRFCAVILRQLREEYARQLKGERIIDPDVPLPCKTCAFRSSTDRMRGFESTTIRFLHSLATGIPFACHLPKPAGGNYVPRFTPDGTPILCAAFHVLTQAPTLDVRAMFGVELIEGIVKVHEASADYRGRYECEIPEWVG